MELATIRRTAGAAAALALLTQAGALAQSGGSLSNVGKVDVSAESSVAGPGYVVYRAARMRTESGMRLDADEVRANLAKGSNALVNVVATGHVNGHLDQIEQGRSYTVTAEKAVYDPKANRIDLSGGVKTVMTSAYTSGPLVQTGDTAVIQLGKAPDYPLITMNHVHTVFTPLH